MRVGCASWPGWLHGDGKDLSLLPVSGREGRV